MPDDLRCGGCYYSFSGPWCDNCDDWPCTCASAEEEDQEYGDDWERDG